MNSAETNLYLEMLQLYHRYGDKVFRNVITEFWSGGPELSIGVLHNGVSQALKAGSSLPATERRSSLQARAGDNLSDLDLKIEEAISSGETRKRQIGEFARRLDRRDVLQSISKLREYAQSIGVDCGKSSRRQIISEIFDTQIKMDDSSFKRSLDAAHAIDSGESTLEGWANIIIKQGT